MFEVPVMNLWSKTRFISKIRRPVGVCERFSNRSFRVQVFASISVHFASCRIRGAAPLLSPQKRPGGGGMVPGGLDTPLGPGFYALKSENDQTNKQSLKFSSKEILKTEIIEKKSSRHRHTIGLTECFDFL